MKIKSYSEAVDALLQHLGEKASKYLPAKYGFEDDDKYYVQVLDNPPAPGKLGGYGGSFVSKTDGRIWHECTTRVWTETDKMKPLTYEDGIWYDD